jgi:hypothetical protein
MLQTSAAQILLLFAPAIVTGMISANLKNHEPDTGFCQILRKITLE